jgi:hypothetical protein
MSKELMRVKSALIPAQPALKTLHSSLASLYPGIERQTTDHRPVIHQGLFACAAHVALGAAAARLHETEFPGEINFPRIPQPDTSQLSGQLSQVVLAGISDSFLQTPPLYKIGPDLIPDCVVAGVVTELKEWMQSALTVLSEESIISVGDFSEDFLIRLIRALAYVTSHSPADDQESLNYLYFRMINVFSFLSMHRYSSLILRPLISAVHQERGRFLPMVEPLTKRLEEILRHWNLQFPKQASEQLEVIFLCFISLLLL